MKDKLYISYAPKLASQKVEQLEIPFGEDQATCQKNTTQKVSPEKYPNYSSIHPLEKLKRKPYYRQLRCAESNGSIKQLPKPRREE